MAPSTREPETLTSPQSNTATAASAGAKSQPAAAEIPVTVNGARTVEGSDRREPFSENAQTVLVFANGAVIRLASPVSSGQLLFLTNEKTKKEVVCQVVKSKSYSSASGYVELEFTEASPGFWGMRFPSSGTAPNLSNPAKPLEIIPALAMKPSQEKTAETKSTAPPATAITDTISSLGTEPAPHRAVQPPRQSPASSAQRPAESKPASVARIESLPAAAKIPTLSEFLTHGQSGPELKGPERVKPVVTERTPEENIQKLRQVQPKQGELAKTLAPGAKSAHDSEKKESLTSLLIPPAVQENPAPGTSTFDFGADEVKIPAWLEPLARNASVISTSPETKTPASRELDAKALEPNPFLAEPAEPLTSRSDSNEHSKTESLSLEPATQDSDSNQQAVFTLGGDGPTPNFGSGLALDARAGEAEDGSQGSVGGLKLGLLAATALLVAGGGWYWYSNQVKDVSANATASAANQIAAPAAASTAAMDSSAKSKSGLPTSTPGGEANRNPLNSQNPRAENKPAETLAAGLSKSAAGEHNHEQPVVSSSHSLEEPAKKPSLGNVHLGAPVLGRSAGSDGGAVAAPALSSDVVPGGDISNGNLLPSNPKQPSAPAASVQVGGDVKTATLLSSVAPAYPQMARNQRVSGDVKIDALIGADGRVSATHVIAGPALLHQAAVDAVRQWKYRAATLNGQQVPMHLTVTVQFKLQQ